MVDIIGRYRGTVDEFQGDGILVFFGAPFSSSDDPERAVACAIEMQNKMLQINEMQRRENLPELTMGIGINTGEVIVGNIGSERRTKYGAVGSAINITYRIESCTQGGQILISSSTYDKVQTKVRIQRTEEMQFKGIDHSIVLYDVIGMDGEPQLSLTKEINGLFNSLEPPVSITCFPLEEKKVSGTAIPGYIMRIAESGGEVLLEGDVTLHSSLKIIFTHQESLQLSEVYAKVISIDQTDSHSIPIRARLEFTWFPEDAKAFLQGKVPKTHA
jgi:hypothetical protein